NVGEEPVTVMKAIHIFTGGSLYGLDPLVNGQPNKAQVMAFERGEKSDDYVTLLPGEGATTRIPDFLSVILELDGQARDSTTGQFDFAMQYKNWIPNVRHKSVFTGSHFLYEVYGDRPVWTGLLESNALTITIVADPAKCDATSP
ncbi:MAG: hypothetical protein K8I30_06020, partial [Anaerolineae bacterium]|nr:hypothetical protein [Anaerolineae bacterium]